MIQRLFESAIARLIHSNLVDDSIAKMGFELCIIQCQVTIAQIVNQAPAQSL